MTSRALFFVFGCLSTGMPRPSSATVIDDPSACRVTTMFEAWPFIASSTELSRISQTRWCSPAAPTPPMYIPGRLRTGSSPSRTVMSFAVYEAIGRQISILLCGRGSDEGQTGVRRGSDPRRTPVEPPSDPTRMDHAPTLWNCVAGAVAGDFDGGGRRRAAARAGVRCRHTDANRGELRRTLQ